MELESKAVLAADALRRALPGIDRETERFRVTSGPLDPELVSALLDYVRDTLPRLHEDLAGGDLYAVGGMAHALKGMGGSVGFPDISALGSLMESAAHSGNAAELRALAQALSSWNHILQGTHT